jgi:pimeloyl-ACP methyl ester carboxylesterase
MENIRHKVKSGNLNLCVFEWPGDSPTILFVHATGFHARCWDEVIKHLPGRHIYSVDIMGHGRSDKPPLPISWAQYTQGLIDCILSLDMKNIIGVGHSMGGFLVTAAAAKLKERFTALVLLDPVIMNAVKMDFFKNIIPEQMFIARRRKNFESPDEMFQNFKNKDNFNHWDPAVLRDYCEYGLLPRKEGSGYELACPPLIEAATYTASGYGGWIYEQLKEIEIPVDVIRANDKSQKEFSFAVSPTNPELASFFNNGRDIQLKEMSHFFPMENPELTAKLITDKISTLH